MRLAALALLCAALSACSGSDEGGDIDPAATVEVPTGEVGPAPPVPDSGNPAAVDSGAMSPR
jgi:hypothetical protein